MRFGVLLPHFGAHASFPRLVDGICLAEQLGFSSVWVRDHVNYHPHDFEDPDPTWLDPIIVLAAAAASTRRITLGTAVFIPYRHPIHDGQILASLASLLGENRLIIGWGRGNDEREFAALGQTDKRRGLRLEEHVNVIRKLWTGESVTHDGRFYSFQDIRLAAPGVGTNVPHLYGGASNEAIKRVTRAFDGLLASRIPPDVLGERVVRVREAAAAAGKAKPLVGLIGLASPGATLEEGLSYFDMELVRRNAERLYPGSRHLGDANAGVVAAGTPDDIARNLTEYADAGVDEYVFDFRCNFANWERWMRLAAEEVIPKVDRPSL